MSELQEKTICDETYASGPIGLKINGSELTYLDESLFEFLKKYLEGEFELSEVSGRKLRKDDSLYMIQKLYQKPPDPKKLTRFEIGLACAVLEECIRKLDIFKCFYPEVKIKFDFLDVFERYLRIGETQIVDNIPEKRHDCDIKRALDIGRLKKVLMMLKDELNDTQSFIEAYVKSFRNKKETQKRLLASYMDLSKKLKDTKIEITNLHLLAEETRMREPVIQLYRQGIYDELAIRYGALVEYLNKYNRARIEQNKLKVNCMMKKNEKGVSERQNKLQKEKICHECILKFYKISQEKLEQEIDKWEKKYLKDIEEIDLRMDVLGEEIGENSSTLAILLTEFNQRKLDMNVFESEKEEALTREARDQLMDSVTIALESWWRGTMARWELGPYSLANQMIKWKIASPVKQQSSKASKSQPRSSAISNVSASSLT